MIYTAKVSEHIHWVGVNDRSTTFFERVWPLDNGMAYNSYVIVDEKCVLVDTVHEANTLELIGRLERVLEGRSLDYIIINHMEPDHSGALPMIASRFPGVKLIGNKLTKRMVDEYYPGAAEFMEVADGDELDLGHHKLKFVPMCSGPSARSTARYSMTSSMPRPTRMRCAATTRASSGSTASSRSGRWPSSMACR
ncbi:MAG: hypothetical protein CSA07_00100 [Bacteroidia bacterium]|nr:MAG: hypothetical protein CSA07_00100 [Bacteroidia bacterium]